MCLSTFLSTGFVIVLVGVIVSAVTIGATYLSCWISEKIFGETDYFILFIIEALSVMSVIIGILLTLVLYLTGYVYFCN